MTPSLARDVPRSERRDTITALVAAEFKAALLMADRDELPLDENYFDLGLTSLRLVEIRDRLEEMLERPVNVTLLFNRPTVRQTVDDLLTTIYGN